MKLIRHKYPILGCIFILLCLILLIRPTWLESIENSFINLNYSIRGSRDVNDNIVVVYLGDEDLQTLGEWPVTRDYYSYLIHILKTSGAKTIGIDILFAYPDKRHPEYDNTLANFMSSAGNVCLPMTFSELKENKDAQITGENPTFPFKIIRKEAAEIGFSNFGKNSSDQMIPLKAAYNDSVYYSFGFQLARNYLGNNKIDYNKARILVNHFGELKRLKSIGFLKLLHLFQTHPDSLQMQNKLVFFAVSAVGVATLKRTPLEESFPSSLLHLTVAENLISKNYLTYLNPAYQLIFLLIFLSLLILIEKKAHQKYFILLSLCLMLICWIISFSAFALLNIILPLFLPLLLLILSSLFLISYKQQTDRLNAVAFKDLLQEQIENKEEQLAQLKIKLQEESASVSDVKKIAEERRQAILILEKEINDLHIHSLPPKKESVIHSEIVYSQSSPMQKVLDLAVKVSSDDIPVLIMGETGTGKELIARTIHEKGSRRDKPFIAVNCGALPENLLESELFGHEKGSFSGAISLRKGRFEIAAGGTVFLDEITETSPTFQIKLLRVLQEGTFERLGGERTLKTNVRIIAASNKNIQDEIEINNFRSDLYYRLNGFPITLPNLKDRIQDIDILSMHFLKKHDYTINISAEAINTLKAYSWPGNVRELENIIRRAALLVKSEKRDLIQEKDLAMEIKDNPLRQNVYYPLEEQILDTLRSLHFSHSAISQTAQMLDNRDRGTITEYFRGMCFEYYVQAGYDKNRAAHQLAQSDDPQVIEKVELKISTYLNNLKKIIKANESAFKGLPKKYHTHLEQIIKNISE